MGFNFIVLVTKSAGFFGGKKGLKFSFIPLSLMALSAEWSIDSEPNSRKGLKPTDKVH